MQTIYNQFPTSRTLYEFANDIAKAVHTSPLTRNQWVTAEIGNMSQRGGHCYLELIEKSPSGQTVAKMRGTIWANSFMSIKAKFEKATGQTFSAGLKVMLFGSANFHEIFGMAFNISDINPSYTLGDLVRIRREILERLEKEGVAGFNQSLPLPLVPQRVAVISSASAAGYGDFMNQLKGNPAGLVFYPVLFEAVMQGERTSRTIREALQRIETTIDLWDCVIIIRGGGATGDLIDFDEIELARAVASFPLPIVVGIGHERDRTVLDELACVRVKTPTAAAEWMISRTLEFATYVRQLTDNICNESRQRLSGAQQQLARIEGLIPTIATGKISESSAYLKKFQEAIPILCRSRIIKEKERLSFIGRYVGQSATGQITRSAEYLKSVADNIRTATSNTLRRNRDALAHTEEMLAALSPENTLRRGYSITYADGHAIKDVSKLKPGTKVTTRFGKGSAISVIDTIQHTTE